MISIISDSKQHTAIQNQANYGGAKPNHGGRHD